MDQCVKFRKNWWVEYRVQLHAEACLDRLQLSATMIPTHTCLPEQVYHTRSVGFLSDRSVIGPVYESRSAFLFEASSFIGNNFI